MLPVRPDISSLSSSDDDADTTRQREEYDEHMLPRALPVTDFPTVNDRSDKGVAVYEHDGLLEKCVVEYVEAVQHKLLVAVANIFIPSRVVLVVVVLVVVLSLFLFLSTGVVPSISAPRLCVRVVKKNMLF